MTFFIKYKFPPVVTLVVCGLLLFQGCNSNDEGLTNLRVQLNRPEVSSEEGDQFLSVETDADVPWAATVTEGADWCFVKPAEGVGAQYTVVQVSENNAATDRTATISVSAGNNVQTVQLTQLKAEILTVTVDKSEVASTPSTVTIQIRTKVDWTATVTSGSDFCSVAPAAGTGNATVRAVFSNNSGDRRTATIVIATETDEMSISVTQVKTGEDPDGSRPEQYVPNRIELPVVTNRRWYVQHQSYAMQYDTAQKHSVWVAYVLNSALLKKNTARSDAWGQDPEIPIQFSSQRSDFYGYDRGHLLPSADRLSSVAYNVETFYYSNMSPQVGAFNQNIWANLETKVRSWAESCDTMYIVTGGAINKGIEVTGHSAGGVTIPKYFFKALVARRGNAFYGAAFWMENKSYTSSATGNKVTYDYAITIRDLEKKTGIDFFHNLDTATEEAVETLPINKTIFPL